jgi:hypothetical protein
VDVYLTDSGVSFWSVQFPVPMTVPDVQDRAPKVFHLKADGFFDAKAGARKQNVDRPQVPFGLGDDGKRSFPDYSW